LKRLLETRIKIFGTWHAFVAQSTYDLAVFYKDQGHYEEADLFFQRSLKIWTHTLGQKHPNVAQNLKDIAELYKTMGKETVKDTPSK
jgi:hypothetical protein